ncbi:hypothetical protein B0G85_1990 [Polynucleobacter brandtiae]|uniref:Uncharacterized protein n=1 Tax=Polynucleobacter brandtiae TaxID=1938816 RepID=A0A2M8VIW0_9BURK|nr:hypothetical protein B0G85_1990 [Polynucleobacter brandtiae]
MKIKKQNSNHFLNHLLDAWIEARAAYTKCYLDHHRIGS